MCDTDDGCPSVLATCCGEKRPKCETADVIAADGTIEATHCLLGFGCAPDAAHYLDKLTARFG